MPPPLNFMIDKMLFDGRHFGAQTRGEGAAIMLPGGGLVAVGGAMTGGPGAQFGGTCHDAARARGCRSRAGFRVGFASGILVSVFKGVCGGGEYVGKHPA